MTFHLACRLVEGIHLFKGGPQFFSLIIMFLCFKWKLQHEVSEGDFNHKVIKALQSLQWGGVEGNILIEYILRTCCIAQQEHIFIPKMEENDRKFRGFKDLKPMACWNADDWPRQCRPGQFLRKVWWNDRHCGRKRHHGRKSHLHPMLSNASNFFFLPIHCEHLC